MLVHQGSAGTGWEGQATGSLAALDALTVLAARGTSLVRIHVELPTVCQPYVACKNKQPFPASMQSVDAQEWLPGAHASAVKAVAADQLADGLRVVSVDARGNVCAARCADADAPPAVAWTAAPTSQVQAGGAGVTLCPGAPLVATTTFWGRTLALFDGDGRCVREERMLHPPAAVTFCSPAASGGEAAGTGNAPLLAVAESGQLSIWDLTRTPACVARRVVSEAPVTCLAAGPSVLAVSGDDRAVSIFEPRLGAKKKKKERKKREKKRRRKKERKKDD